MTILYGFTKDQGFAMVDTDTRAYLYGYPTSDVQRLARRAGCRNAALSKADGLKELGQFILRLKGHNLGTPYEDQCEQTIAGGYDNVRNSLVAPQSLE